MARRIAEQIKAPLALWALAAALKLKERVAGQKVALVQSGGNLSMQRLKEVLCEKV